jgi:hypothetical protein
MIDNCDTRRKNAIGKMYVVKTRQEYAEYYLKHAY